MGKAGFCQILGRHALTKCHVTSRPVVGFSQNLFQKMRDTLPEKVTENYHAISGGRAAAENFVQGEGGVNLTPPSGHRVNVLICFDCSKCLFFVVEMVPNIIF